MSRGCCSIPLIDVTSLVTGGDTVVETVQSIGRACRDAGFFYVVGHGVEEALALRLEQLSRQFFALSLPEKLALRMEISGRAWRGYFPVGAELTSGQPDQKEGLYFGAELPADHPKVRGQVPLHGSNLFPQIDGFRSCVLRYLDQLTNLGHALMKGIALSLELDEDYFDRQYTRDPLILLRIFHYPPLPPTARIDQWSVGEHTDYGLLTILRQDDAGGLQVKSGSNWIDAPPIPQSFVCNIGDMLDKMTGGRYRSTPHRVRNRSQQSRLSIPFFFDPNFDAMVQPIDPRRSADDDRQRRWDKSSVHQWKGTYGDYILKKVARVFPDL